MIKSSELNIIIYEQKKRKRKNENNTFSINSRP